MQPKNDSWHFVDVRLAAVVASLLIMVLTIMVPDSPNDDAFIYVRTAEIFLEQGLAAAFQHYAWASYSILFALVSLTGLSLFSAAHLVSGLFFALLVYSFLSIVREIDSSNRVMVLAAICILLYPQLNEYRYLIIRDAGYWALSLFALWQLLMYRGNRDLKAALAFCAALLMAAAFRSEALVYLLLAPFSLLIGSDEDRQLRRAAFYRLMGCAGFSVLLLAVLLSAAGVDLPGLFIQFFSVYEPFLNSAFNPSEAEASEIARVLFGDHASAYSQDYIVLFMAVGLLVVLAGNLFNGIGGPFFWLLVYGGLKNYLRIPRHVVIPVVAFVLINAAILFVFLYVTRFLSSRYAMLFCLLVSLAVPLVLARLVENLQGKSLAPYGMRILILFFGYCGFDSFISFGESKDYVYDSVDWVVEAAADDTALLTNNHSIAYFSGRVEDYDKTLRVISEQAIRDSRSDDLIVLEMHYEMAELVNRESVQPLLRFETGFPSDDEQEIAIYRRL